MMKVSGFYLFLLFLLNFSVISCSCMEKLTLKKFNLKEDNNVSTKDGKNMTDQEKFLEENKKNNGVKIRDSGLQYLVLKEGNGKSPTRSDTVEVHYKGTLIDGAEFDSSYRRNQSISFPLSGVILGWTEGLQLMKEGAKYKFFIPSELAYGERVLPGIPANSVLIFEVELIKVL